MANRSLFQSLRLRLAPRPDAVNEAGGVAYRLGPRHELAQYAATGCMHATYYASAEDQLESVLSLCAQVEPEFIARTALYCRAEAHMKDLPALLCAVLSVRSPGLLAEVFGRVIDTPKMLRNFVQIMRSGAVGRRSLGTLPKRLVLQWLESRSDEALFFASVGAAPSLADILRMTHPAPATPSRGALFAYILGRAHEPSALPDAVRRYEAFKSGLSDEVPDVPFQMLTSLPLDSRAWGRIARNGSWQMTRMNLNTFARHGVFTDPEAVRLVAERLADPTRIARARALPYQLLTARAAASPGVPVEILRALESALEIAAENAPRIPRAVWVFVDVSGSMHSPLTGVRKGSTSVVRCLDVAALFAAAVVRTNPHARVLAFSDRAQRMQLDTSESIYCNVQRLAALPGGGTNCSAPLKLINHRRFEADTVIYVSDSESWIDTTPGSYRLGTETMRQWEILKTRNPKARMVCIDLQPYSTTQAPNRGDILNVGGFSDAVFDVIRRFVDPELSAQHWVDRIEAVSI